MAVLVVSFLANYLNYLDRFLVSALLPYIQDHFAISDVKAGYLVSAFTIGYLISSPFVGYLADRYSRTLVFGVCVLIWSVATILCAVVKTFSLLILLRALIGIGEAGCLAVGPSLLSGRFSERNRGKILSIFYLGVPIGSTSAFLLAGLITGNYPWQLAFYIAGIPGIIIGVILAMIKDVRAQLVQPPAISKSDATLYKGQGALTDTSPVLGGSDSILVYMGFFRDPAFVLLSLAQMVLSFAFVPILHFGVKYFVNVRGLDESTVQHLFAGAGLISGVLGVAAGGYLGDIVNRRFKGGYMLLCGLSLLIGMPFLWFASVSASVSVVAGCIGVSLFSFFMVQPAVNAQLASIIDESRRAMAFALTLFCMHILGDTISPPIFGLIADMHGMDVAFRVFTLLVPVSALVCFAAFARINRKSG